VIFVGTDPFWPEPAFAELDRISADMDRFWSSFDERVSDLMMADQNLLTAMADSDMMAVGVLHPTSRSRADSRPKG
jgi:hypothetical protein